MPCLFPQQIPPLRGTLILLNRLEEIACTGRALMVFLSLALFPSLSFLLLLPFCWRWC